MVKLGDGDSVLERAWLCECLERLPVLIKGFSERKSLWMKSPERLLLERERLLEELKKFWEIGSEFWLEMVEREEGFLESAVKRRRFTERESLLEKITERGNLQDKLEKFLDLEKEY